MTADPRTLAAALRQMTNPTGYALAVDTAAAFIESVVPLHDAWLAAKPPCKTQGFMEDNRHWIITGGNEYRLHDGTWVKPCPACPDSPGVQPFAEWVAGLVALWTAVWADPMGIKPEGHMKCEPCALCVLEHLRGIR